MEECFSKVKGLIPKLREEGLTLFESIELALERVTRENCQGWYRHAEAFLPQCINSQQINVQPEIESSSEREYDWSDSDELLCEL